MITAFDRTRYPWLFLAFPHDEDEVQRDVLQLLELRDMAPWSVDVGGKALRGKTRSRGAAGTKGIPDVFGYTPAGRLIAIECKRPAWLHASGRVLREAGKPTPEQLHWLDKLRSRGALCCIAWSVDDVIELLKGA